MIFIQSDVISSVLKIISGIDRIIFATGFRYTYPFLPQYHNSKLGVNDTAPVDGIQPIVTDGTHLRSLYLDAFYIPDPTLTFINCMIPAITSICIFFADYDCVSS
jgi:hypothetical protein